MNMQVGKLYQVIVDSSWIIGIPLVEVPASKQFDFSGPAVSRISHRFCRGEIFMVVTTAKDPGNRSNHAIVLFGEKLLILNQAFGGRSNFFFKLVGE